MKPRLKIGAVSVWIGCLYIVDGWWCEGDRRSYFGVTPAEAFERWKSETPYSYLRSEETGEVWFQKRNLKKDVEQMWRPLYPPLKPHPERRIKWYEGWFK